MENSICVKKPQTENEALDIVKQALAAKRGLIPAGNLTRLKNWPWLMADEEALILSAGSFKGAEIKRANLSASVGAGLTVKEFNELLKPEGLYFPVHGPHINQRSLGALMAEGLPGLESSKGRFVDWVLGLSLITPRGELAKNGGQTLKNVSGYDLTRLNWRAWGRLGFNTEFILKLLPLPQVKQAWRVKTNGSQEAVDLAEKIILSQIGPDSLRIFVSSKAGDKEPVWSLGVGFNGFAEAVEIRAAKLKEAVQGMPGLSETLAAHDDPDSFWEGRLGGWSLDNREVINIFSNRRGVLSQIADLNIQDLSPILIKADFDILGGVARYQINPEALAERPGVLKMALRGPNPDNEIMRRLKNLLDPEDLFFPSKYFKVA